MSKRWRYSIIIFSLVTLALLFWQSPPKEIDAIKELISQEPADENGREKRYPSAFLEDSLTRQFTTEGRVEYELAASKILFFERPEHTSTLASKQENYIEYQQPILLLYGEPDTDPIKISAQQGWSDNDGEKIILEKDVVIIQKLFDGSEYQLSTESLTLFPDRKFAETDKPVMITQPSGVTTAVGLQAFFDQERIELLSKVRGEYAR